MSLASGEKTVPMESVGVWSSSLPNTCTVKLVGAGQPSSLAVTASPTLNRSWLGGLRELRATVGVMMGFGFLAVKVAGLPLLLLLAGFGSAVDEVTLAVSLIEVPSVTLQLI